MTTPGIPRAAPAGAPDAAALLEQAPAALWHLDADGRVRWANAAARQLLGAAFAEPGLALAQAIGLDPAAAAPAHAARLGRLLHWRAQPLADGSSLVQIEDATALDELQAELQHQRELLDLVQDFGRLGLWQRDMRTLAGHWDRHVYKFWGLDPEASAPDREAAGRAIVDEDRAAVDAAFDASRARPGRYECRYRVRRADGSIRHLHSQWEVAAGADGEPALAVGVLTDDTESVEAARSHLAVESQLALAGSMADVALWRHDLRTDRMHYNNSGFKVLGMPPRAEGIPLDEVRQLIHPDDLPQVIASARAALASDGPVDVDARYRRADGRWVHVMMRRVAQRDERGQPVAFLGVALDITARTEATQRAQLLARRFDLAARTAGIGYWSSEGAAERPQWSTQMRELHGLTRHDVVPTLKEWLEQYLHPDDRVRVGAEFRQWLGGQTAIVHSELRIVRRDGQERRLLTHSHREVDGERTVQFGIVIDVTERRQADMALRGAEQRAALAARGAGLGTWEVDRDRHTVFWDEQMWRLRGLAPQPVPPDPEAMVACVHPEDRAAARRHTERASRADDVVEHAFRVVWPDGSVHWLASRSASVKDASGRAVRRIGINWDITSARQSDEERRERETAERASRAKSEFLARMSHELRTPLNAVLGFTQLMMADGARGEPAVRQQRLAHVLGAGRHLLALINDVLDLASLDTGDLRVVAERVDVATLLHDTLPLLEAQRTERGLTLALRLGDGLALHADPIRLRQVLLNLLSNAIKYNHPGGHIEVSAEPAGRIGRLRVRDTGPGMTAAQLQHVFEPFNRLGQEHSGIEGTGIGLAIAKALAERMGGGLQVHSEPGAGSSFELNLPLADPGAVAVPAVPRTGADTPAAPGRELLYIEDNAINTLIVQQLLRHRPDLTLISATDGASGLAAARAHRPALVLLDMQLPDMDGLDVLRRLKSDPATAGLRCVAVSANALPEDVARAYAAGVADYWTKPLDLDAFLAALTQRFGPAPG